jgi:hypothetical protein
VISTSARSRLAMPAVGVQSERPLENLRHRPERSLCVGQLGSGAEARRTEQRLLDHLRRRGRRQVALGMMVGQAVDERRWTPARACSALTGMQLHLDPDRERALVAERRGRQAVC